MKNKTNSKVVTLTKVLTLTAALALPSVALAANADSNRITNGSVVLHFDRPAVTHRAEAQFNLIDGQPIR